MRFILGGVLILVIAGCAPRSPVTDAEKAGLLIHNIEALFAEQTPNHRPSAFFSVLDASYDSLMKLKISAPSDAEKNLIQNHIEELKCFLAYRIMQAFMGGTALTHLPDGVTEGKADDYREVSYRTLEDMYFDPSIQDIISVNSILEYCRKQQDKVPYYSFAYSVPASFHLLYGIWNDAVALAEQALMRNPDDAIALRTLSVIYCVRGKDAVKLEEYTSRWKKQLREPFRADFMLSQVAEEMNDLPLAIAYAEKSLAKIRQVEYIQHLSRLHEKAGNLEKAKYYKSMLLEIAQYAGKPMYEYAESEMSRLRAAIKRQEKPDGLAG